MKKLVLLGDSIRLFGYGTVIQDLLPEYEIYQPEENCRFAKYLLRLCFELKEQIENADVIHFNAGLWDTCALFDDGIPFSSIEEYKETIRRVAEILKRYGKRIIFSTTTPIRKGQPHNTNQRILDFNNAVVPMLIDMGVEIVDLYALIIKDPEKYLEDDLVHLTEEAKLLAANLIANKIKE